MFTKIDHVLGHKESPSKCHKVEINKKTLKGPSIWKLSNNNNSPLNYYWVKGDVKLKLQNL